MPALSFEAPTHSYVHRFQVQAEDIDGLGHANNVVWVRWINEAAIAHSGAVGFGLARCLAAGVVWVVRRHDVEYLLPAFQGDAIEAWTWPHTLRAAASLRRTVFRRGDQVLARSETTWALMDPKSGRPRRVPPEMLEAYGVQGSQTLRSAVD